MLTSSGVTLVGLIVFLILILFYRANVDSVRYKNYLAGMWVGDSAFLDKSGLSEFNLFINRENKAYILMRDNDGNVVANQLISLSANININSAIMPAWKKSKDCLTAKIKISCKESCPLISVNKMALSMLDSTLTLYDDKKLFAFLHKDIQASSLALSI